jgi:pilus assembly protein Flp/PilA
MPSLVGDSVRLPVAREWPMVRRLLEEEDAQTLVEYGVLVALIALIVIVILSLLGDRIRNVFVEVNSGMNSTAPGGDTSDITNRPNGSGAH